MAKSLVKGGFAKRVLVQVRTLCQKILKNLTTFLTIHNNTLKYRKNLKSHLKRNLEIFFFSLKFKVSYAIGVAEPMSIFVDSYGTGSMSDENLTELVKHNFDLRPGAIVK